MNSRNKGKWSKQTRNGKAANSSQQASSSILNLRTNKEPNSTEAKALASSESEHKRLW